MKFVPKKIEEYCVNQSLSDNELLKALSNKTWEKEEIPEMLCGPLVSGLLHFLINSSNNVLLCNYNFLSSKCIQSDK